MARKKTSENGQKKITEEKKSLVLSLACPYLMAQDLLSLSLTCNAVRTRLRNGSARTLKVDLWTFSHENCKRVLSLYRRSLDNSKELILFGSRAQVFFALHGAAGLRLTRLAVKTDDSDDLSSSTFLSGVALSAAYAGFPHLERLELRNIGPFAPKAIIRSCSSQGLRMVRLSNCPTLLDACLSTLVAQLPSLRELSIEECPGISSPVLRSESLARLRLAKCFSLRSVNIDQCSNLVILDTPWTVSLINAPSIPSPCSLRYISLVGSAKLQRLEIDSLPTSLSSIDLECCAQLNTIMIGSCSGLVYLNIAFCVELETIILKKVHLLEELDVSLLVKLCLIELTEDFSFRKLIKHGCDKLHPSGIRTSLSMARHSLKVERVDHIV